MQSILVRDLEMLQPKILNFVNNKKDAIATRPKRQ